MAALASGKVSILMWKKTDCVSMVHLIPDDFGRWWRHFFCHDSALLLPSVRSYPLLLPDLTACVPSRSCHTRMPTPEQNHVTSPLLLEKASRHPPKVRGDCVWTSVSQFCPAMPPKRTLGRVGGKTMSSRIGSSKGGSQQETRTAKRPRQASGKKSVAAAGRFARCRDARREPRSLWRDSSIRRWFLCIEYLQPDGEFHSSRKWYSVI